MLKWVRWGYKENSREYSWVLDEKCENEADAKKEVVRHSKIWADTYDGLYILSDFTGKVLARWKFKNGKLYKEEDRDPNTLPFFLRKLREMLEKRWKEVNVLPGEKSGEKKEKDLVKEIIRVTLGRLNLLCLDILEQLAKPTTVNPVYKHHTYSLEIIERIREKVQHIRNLIKVAISHVGETQNQKEGESI